MPTRRTMVLVVVVVVAMHPVAALAKLWAHHTLATAEHGSVAKGTAEIVSVIA